MEVDHEDNHPQPTQLNEGEVWVKYHPASGKSPKILNSEHNPILPPTPLPPVVFDQRSPPWHPFKCRADFEQAEIFLRFNVSDTQINAQLKLNDTFGHADGVTMKSAKEFHRILEQVPALEMSPEVSCSHELIGLHLNPDFNKVSDFVIRGTIFTWKSSMLHCTTPTDTAASARSF